MRNFKAMQVARYVASAGAVAALYLSVYWVGLQFSLHYLVAIFIAHIVSIGIAFPLYRNFVFASVGSLGSDLARFLGTWASGAVVGVIATPILVEFVNIQAFWAHIVAVVSVGALTYIVHRVFTFGPQRVAKPDRSGNGVRVAA